jgi:hypothetical protein
MVPTTRKVSPSPIECAVLQMPYIRPRSRLLNHAVMATTPPGAPRLWNQPFNPHSTTEKVTAVENPMPILQIALNAKPAARKRFMLA